MTKDEFADAITYAVKLYFSDRKAYDPNPMLRIDPASLMVMPVSGRDFLGGLADSMEAIEDAAAVDGDADEQATDAQNSRNPDFYPLKDFYTVTTEGPEPNLPYITDFARRYMA